MTRVTLGKSRVREIRPPGSVRAKAEWLSYSTTTLMDLYDPHVRHRKLTVCQVPYRKGELPPRAFKTPRCGHLKLPQLRIAGSVSEQR